MFFILFKTKEDFVLTSALFFVFLFLLVLFLSICFVFFVFGGAISLFVVLLLLQQLQFNAFFERVGDNFGMLAKEQFDCSVLMLKHKHTRKEKNVFVLRCLC